MIFVALLAGCGGGGADAVDGGENENHVGGADAAPECVPRTCAEEELACGELDDGCGGTLTCFPCPPVLALDVKTVQVSGVVTANGQLPTQSCAATGWLRGRVIFSEEDGPATFRLDLPCAGASDPFTFSGRVYPGTYRVSVLGLESSLPSSGITVAAGLEILADRAGLAWDLGHHVVSGTVTLNGQVPAQSCTGGSRAQVQLLDRGGGGHFVMRVPCEAPGTPYRFSGSVPSGVYELSVMGENSTIPSSSHVVDPAFVVDGDREDVALDLVTHTVSGSVTLNGAVPGSSTCRLRRGTVSFQALGGSVTLPIPCTAAGGPYTFSGEVYPGVYQLVVAGDDLPPEPYRPEGTVEIAGAVPDLVVDVKSVPLAGTVTLNGATPPPCTGATWGEVYAYETTRHYNFSMPVACVAGGPFAFSGDVYPGTYHVSVRIGDGEPLSLDPALEVTGPTSGLRLDTTRIAHTVAGFVTVNGRAPDAPCEGQVDLADTVSGVAVTLPLTCGAEAAFSGSVPPGSYRVSLHGAGLPAPYFVPAPLVVSAPVSDVRFDVVTRAISGTVTLDGAVPACDPGAHAARVTFEDPVSHVSIVLQGRCGGASEGVRFEGELFPGVYDVVVSGMLSDLPEARARVMQRFELL